MDRIADILSDQTRSWSGNPPAQDDEIQKLVNAAGIELPAAYIELLRYCNGGQGDLGLPPLLLQLYPAAYVAELAEDSFYQSEFPEYFFFGSNGGLEMIAFDTTRIPFAVVMIDPIAGKESAFEIASDTA